MKIEDQSMIARQTLRIESLREQRETARQAKRFIYMHELEKQIAKEEKALQEAKMYLMYLRRTYGDERQTNDC